MTELGGPSFGGIDQDGKEIVRLGDGRPFTQETQKIMYEEYIAGITNMRSSGVPIDLLMWHTIKDGEASTNVTENSFGLYDSNWNLKPAGWVVAAQAAKPW
jgi:hypothetical protein